jgi:hypothetical protein
LIKPPSIVFYRSFSAIAKNKFQIQTYISFFISVFVRENSNGALKAPLLYGRHLAEDEIGQDVAEVELEADDDFSPVEDALSLFLLSVFVSLDSVFDSEVDFDSLSPLASPFCPLRA